MEAMVDEHKDELRKDDVYDEEALYIGLAIHIGAGTFIQEKQAMRYIKKHQQKECKLHFPISHHERGNGNR